MGFLAKLLQVISLVPAFITGIEGLFGAKRGTEKKEKVVSLVGLTLGLAEAITAKDIVDQDAFQDGLRAVIDGTVKMLNASIWHK